MKVLVLGGTRFFGKILVERLINDGLEVTLMTRGETPDPFGGRVRRMKCDRSDHDGMNRCLKGKHFDVVYDQICFSPDDARITCDLFNGADIGKYIFTSSAYVYQGQGDILKEDAFKPEAHAIEMGSRDRFSYAQGKRLAEVYFAHKAMFPVISVRFPVVMGKDDYTGRFAHYISRLLFHQTIYLPRPQGRMNFINSREAADFLFWLRSINNDGPINAASEESFDAEELVHLFSRTLGTDPRIVKDARDSDETLYPYSRKDNLVMDIAKGKSWGYSFLSFHEWFPQEVESVKKALLAESCP